MTVNPRVDWSGRMAAVSQTADVTLLLQAPEFLAALHQLTAALLLCTAVWHAFELRYAARA